MPLKGVVRLLGQILLLTSTAIPGLQCQDKWIRVTGL